MPPIRVLVTDDSVVVRRIVSEVIDRDPDLEVVGTARDGADGLRQIEALNPDIMTLDVEMPRMDGYQFATHVRNDPRVKDTPIVMITSRSSEKHRARAIEIGVNDYLVKPYQENQLMGALQPFIGAEDE